MARQSGLDLGKVFDEYLRTTMVPALEYRLRGGTLSYRWADVVPGFDMPVRVRLAPDSWTFCIPQRRGRARRPSSPMRPPSRWTGTST